jgi:hypothetical protein
VQIYDLKEIPLSRVYTEARGPVTGKDWPHLFLDNKSSNNSSGKLFFFKLQGKISLFFTAVKDCKKRNLHEHNRRNLVGKFFVGVVAITPIAEKFIINIGI